MRACGVPQQPKPPTNSVDPSAVLSVEGNRAYQPSILLHKHKEREKIEVRDRQGQGEQEVQRERREKRVWDTHTHTHTHTPVTDNPGSMRFTASAHVAVIFPPDKVEQYRLNKP